MRQSRDIAISDGNLANAANKIAVNTAIGANPTIWARGSSGEELDEDDAVAFRSIVRGAYDAAFFEFARMRRLGANDVGENLVADFSAFLFKNPGARRVWVEEVRDTTNYRDLLTTSPMIVEDKFVESVKSNLAKLDQLRG